MNLLDPGPVPPQTWATLNWPMKAQAEAGYALVLAGDRDAAMARAARLSAQDRDNAMAAAAVWIAILGNVDCGMATFTGPAGSAHGAPDWRGEDE